jgi:type II secretory ATPase GspE/PulE/Tfp pilus assembly ATPase PilB-like protein
MAYDDDYIPPIQFTPAGATPEVQEETLEVVTPSPGFPATAQLLAEAIQRESFTTVLDFTPQQVSVRFQIDGLWHSGTAMDRETGDYMLATLKKIAGLNFRERRARQEGQFETHFLKKKQKVRVVSQGIKTGERVAIYLDWKRPSLDKVADLGMREGMIKQLSPILENPETGLVVVSAIPGEGYTSAWRGVLDACDRLTRDYFVIEEKDEVEPEVINIYSVEFDRSRGENALSPITQLLLKQPDVLAFNELPDAETIDGIVELSTNKNMPVFVRAPGKNALDSVLRLLALKPDVEKFAHRLTAVVSMRLIRKLCEKCRISYTPHPNLLKKLGIPPGRIAELFKPFVYQPGMVDEKENEIEPCRECHGIGYKGRTGLFELLVVNDAIRQALVNRTKLSQLMALAQRSGHVTMQQEGIVQVARGLTSLEELQRVLKA